MILLRSDGDRVNTHLRSFKSPMGMARSRGLLAIATQRGVWEFHEQPALSERADPSGRTDTCFVPRRHLVTGDIRTHEIAYVGGELWAVNTRFSCLASFDGIHSFVPQWRPPFVSALAPDDRCHLNGFALSGGRPVYVTAHGRTDETNGWRDGKVGGGVVIDVPTGEIVVSGLSMPHSPRMLNGRLWLCDSGHGRVIVADPQTGQTDVVAELPGFTRGLAFAGRVAFVGLSQVREHVFADLPLGDRLEERLCGVWALDTITGATLGYIRFDGTVQEIFDVQLLRGTNPEPGRARRRPGQHRHPVAHGSAGRPRPVARPRRDRLSERSEDPLRRGGRVVADPELGPQVGELLLRQVAVSVGVEEPERSVGIDLPALPGQIIWLYSRGLTSPLPFSSTASNMVWAVADT